MGCDAVAVGGEGGGAQDVVEGFDGGGAEFGGLDSGSGVGEVFDSGEPGLDMGEFEPFGDGEDGGVELERDVGEGEVGSEDGTQEFAFVGGGGEGGCGEFEIW